MVLFISYGPFAYRITNRSIRGHNRLSLGFGHLTSYYSSRFLQLKSLAVQKNLRWARHCTLAGLIKRWKFFTGLLGSLPAISLMKEYSSPPTIGKVMTPSTLF